MAQILTPCGDGVRQLSLDEAQTLINRWNAFTNEQKGAAIGGIKAFLIPHYDVQGLFHEAPYAIRVYLAAEEDGTAKLVIVGAELVDDIYQDMIGAGEESMIYDFTCPCPPTCSSGSPLMPE